MDHGRDTGTGKHRGIGRGDAEGAPQGPMGWGRRHAGHAVRLDAEGGSDTRHGLMGTCEVPRGRMDDGLPKDRRSHPGIMRLVCSGHDFCLSVCASTSSAWNVFRSTGGLAGASGAGDILAWPKSGRPSTRIIEPNKRSCQGTASDEGDAGRRGALFRRPHPNSPDRYGRRGALAMTRQVRCEDSSVWSERCSCYHVADVCRGGDKPPYRRRV